jgi:flagellar protein FlaF
MGFSVSGAAAVVFVGLLVSAAALYPAVDGYTERRSDAIADREERALDRQNTAVRITNATYDGNTLTVEAENTGAATLAVGEVDLLVDGEYGTPSAEDIVVAGSSTTEVWAPGERVTVTTTRSAAPDRVKLVTGPGVAVTAQVEVV